MGRLWSNTSASFCAHILAMLAGRTPSGVALRVRGWFDMVARKSAPSGCIIFEFLALD